MRMVRAAVLALAGIGVVAFQQASLPAQQSSAAQFGPIVGYPVGVGASPNVAGLPQEAPPLVTSGTGVVVRPLYDLPPRTATSGTADATTASEQDGALQSLTPLPNMPATGVSFDGLSSQDNQAAYGSRFVPPDTNGEAGLTHYVQAVNNLVGIYSKTGTGLLTPPFKMSSLFATLGGICATNDNGDPIVLYDQLANRWILTQFAFASPTTPPFHQCIAVSKTGDPLPTAGAYYVYDFVMPGTYLNDYSKLGVWPDAYYMTDNQFTTTGAFAGVGVFAFDRAKMLVGDPSATFIYFNLGGYFAVGANAGGGMLPADLDGATPPPAGTPNYFAMLGPRTNYFATGGATDTMRLFGFHADFANPAASTFIERPESPVAVAVFDARNPTSGSDIEQPTPAASTAYLDSIQDRLMQRLAYRNFGGTRESLVVTHTVNVGPNPVSAGGHQAAVRYYELRRSLPGGAFTVPEQATFAPDADNRWMASAAMDKLGNLAVGYSVSSATTYPSIRYAGRLASDPPNGLYQGEAVLIDGSGVQLSTSGRWGDYSSLTVDPVDDCTFWYTNQYYTAVSQTSSTAGWLTYIGSFKFPGCVGDPTGIITGTVREVGTNTPIANAKVAISPGGSSSYTDAAGFYTQALPPGTYTLTASAPPGHGSQTVAGLTISAGITTVLNFSLPVTVPPAITTQPANAIVAAGQDASFTVAASGIPPPGYQWQVSTNAGASWTTLTDTAPYSGTTTATLLVTGATVGLSGAQYRSIAANSAGSATSTAATLTVTAGTLTGLVTSASTSAPIANALVSISPGGLSATTDATGLYTRAVPPGTFTVTASAPNYLSTVASSVVVTNGGTTTRDFALASGTAMSFDGLSSQDNQNAYGGRGYPPDTNGEVGKNHYVQMVNRLVGIYDKSGTQLMPPFKLSSLFASLGGICATNDNGDPIVLYDQLADRWVLSQFAFTSPSSPPYHQCIAVSTTGDPTGTYFQYDFIMPGSHLNDYPKLGVWPDAYYMTDNQFTNGATFAGAGVFAFDRAKMLAGDPTATYIYFNLGTSYFGMLPADLDGATPPPAGTPNYFATLGDTDNTVRLFGFHADFVNPAASTFTEIAGSPVAVTAFDLRSPISAGRRVIEQPPPATASHYLDAIQPLLMHRLAYRNFGSHESLVVTHTVNVGPDPTTVDGHQAAIRYYEFRRASSGAMTVNEQATFAPDADNRWMGSAAMDGAGNLAIGYSVSSLTTFPSIRYAWRLATDPPNALVQGETEIVTGSGVQLGTAGRWGDYSSLTVDPTDDCTFWYTNEYYTAASQASSAVGWVTRIARFRIPTCGGAPAGTITGYIRDASTNAPIARALVSIAPNGPSVYTDATGRYTRLMPPGTYTVTASAQYYSTESAAGVVVADGATTTSDLALTFTHGTLTGQVRDATTNAGIAGALVSISPGGLSATTDANGLYSKVILPGTYTLAASASGYLASPSASGIVVAQGGTTTTDFALVPLFVQATYDSTLKAPKCGLLASGCDSGPALLLGRDSLSGGAEPNQPNTILNSCPDGTLGTFHVDESVDRIRIATTDGSALAAGKPVTIETTVWVFSTSSDRLDLYYASNPSSPTWTLITTVTPSATGAQTLSASFVLPSGGLQAVRARFRYSGSAAACTGSTSNWDDHDDLIFTDDTTPAVPAFYVQPSSQTVATGYTATFSAAASGYPAPAYQWQISTDGGNSWSNLTNVAPYSGVTTATLSISAVTAAQNNSQFRAVATNGVGPGATSSPATLTVVNALSVSTVAGLATVLGTADGTGSAARFNSPSGVAVDSAGTVYVADTDNHAIRKVTPAGDVTTLAGLKGASGSSDGTGTGARFYSPYGVAVDSGGTVYVADTSNHTIRKITPAGVVTTLAGLAGAPGSTDGTGSAARFFFPFGVAVDSSGTIYVGDTFNNTIRKITTGGVVTTLAGSAGTAGSTDGTGSAARFFFPTGLAVDSGGTIYVADTLNQTIRQITAAGVVTTLAGSPGGGGSADGTGSAARFLDPGGVAVDAAGIVFVADTDNHTIRQIAAGGVVTTIAGLATSSGAIDGTGLGARLNTPISVAVHDTGTVYVADTNSHTVRKGVRASAGSPVFTIQPTSQIVNAGQDAAFTVAASGTPTPTLQWQVSTNGGVSFIYLTNTAPYSGVTTATLTVSGVTAALNNYQFRAVATNSAGSANSNAATLTVSVAPTITTQPANQIVDEGLNASFVVAAGGTPTPTLQWQVSTDNGASFTNLTNTAPYSGVTTTTLTVAGATAALGGYRYRAVATNIAGTATSNAAMLLVNTTGAPVITVQPTSQAATAGGAASFTVAAIGTPAPGYQWQLSTDGGTSFADLTDTGPYSGVMTPTLTVTGVTAGMSGHRYRCVAISSSGGAISSAATLTVTSTFTFTTLAGSGGHNSIDGTGTSARFFVSWGVVVDSASAAYVADANSHTIRKISSAGVVTTVAGVAGSIGSADGTGTAARFNFPRGLAIDAADNVFITDATNHTIRKMTPAGVVTTVAGRAGYAGSTDGTAGAARFNFPYAVAVDSAGTLYVAEVGNDTIRKITSAGVVSTLAGLAGSFGSTDGTGSAARFNNPEGIAVDGTGAIYVADSSNNTIRRITAAGAVTTLAGTAGSAGSTDGTGAAARFTFPLGVAVNAAGTIYVADQGNYTIRAVETSTGLVTTLAGLAANPGSVDGTGSAARFYLPRGVAVSTSGTVWVTDSGNDMVRTVTTTAGVTATVAGATSFGSVDGVGGTAKFFFPRQVAIDTAGTLYVPDSSNHTIRRVTAGGAVTTLAGLAASAGSVDGTGGAARFFAPYGVAVDTAWNVYVADTSNHTIRKITPGGVVTTLAGSAGSAGSTDGTGSSARFNFPRNLAIDSAGTLYVADSSNHLIRKVTAAGVVTTLAGTAGSSGSVDGTGSAARFNAPFGVAVDSAGTVYVSDSSNSTIRKVTAAGVVTTLAGKVSTSGSLDGTGSAARFAFPTGVAVDSSGTLYVADTNNNTIRTISAAGDVTTLAGLAGVTGNTDGTGGVVRFYLPYGVAVDSAGNVYVGDTTNSNIRKGTPPTPP